MATRRVTTVRQLELMVNFMLTHRQLALGRLCGKEYAATAHKLWEQLAEILNSEGPSRIGKEWAKIWTETKSKVRKKLMDERAGISGTGGGPHSSCILTPLQEQIADIIGRDVGPIPGGRVHGQVPKSHDHSFTQNNMETEDGDNTEMIAIAQETINYDHLYEIMVPHAEVTIEVEAGPSTSSPRVVRPAGSPQPRIDTSPEITRRRPPRKRRNSGVPHAAEAGPSTSSPRVVPPVPRTPQPQVVRPVTGSPEPRVVRPVTGSPQPRLDTSSPEITQDRRPPPRIRQRRNNVNSDDRVTSSSSLMTVKDTLSRIELIRAETGRQLAAAAVQQANAAAQNAEAAMRQAHAWERNAEGLLALANAISNIALLHRPQNE